MIHPGLTVQQVRDIVATEVVGRSREQRLVISALAAGRDLLLEGPPGTSKTTLLRSITAAFGVPLVFVEGNADLTTPKLVGHHDPAQALAQGFSAETFVSGPLVRAMQSGGFLYVEEINRAPEETLNALLTAIAEREITVPRMGIVHARPGFRLVASMNPFDSVGTSRISTSVYDRLCRVAIGYQTAAEEDAIVVKRTGHSNTELIADSVAVARITRIHPQVRQGSSVRGAIDLVLVADQLLSLDPPADFYGYAATMRDAMHVALSGRIRLDEVSAMTPEMILDEIWEQHFVLERHAAAPG